MTTRIVVINGNARVGKDTFAEKLKKHYRNGAVRIHSTIHTVKQAAIFFGADENIRKGDAERLLWSDMKDLYTKYNDGPFQEIVNSVSSLDLLGGHPLLIVFAREPEEIAKLKTRFRIRCFTVLIAGFQGASHVPNNHADQNVEAYPYDLKFLNNDTLAEFEEKAKKFANYLIATQNHFME